MAFQCQVSGPDCHCRAVPKVPPQRRGGLGVYLPGLLRFTKQNCACLCSLRVPRPTGSRLAVAAPQSREAQQAFRKRETSSKCRCNARSVTLAVTAQESVVLAEQPQLVLVPICILWWEALLGRAAWLHEYVYE